MLFQQGGTKVHASPRIAVFAVSADGKDCSHNGCGPVASFIAWEIGLASATKKTILSKDNLSSVKIVWGSDEERVAMVVDERPSARHLLRWRAGEATASYTPLPKGPSSDTQQSWLTKSDELVEVWLLDDKSLEIKRFPLKGEPRSSGGQAGAAAQREADDQRGAGVGRRDDLHARAGGGVAGDRDGRRARLRVGAARGRREAGEGGRE